MIAKLINLGNPSQIVCASKYRTVVFYENLELVIIICLASTLCYPEFSCAESIDSVVVLVWDSADY